MLKWLLSIVIMGSTVWGFGDDLAKQNRQEIMRLKQIVVDQNERIDGLTSLIEGLSTTLGRLEQERATIHKDDKNNEIMRLIKDLGVMIDTINAHYLSKEAFQHYVENGTLPDNKVQKENSKPISRFLNSKERYSQGVRLFVKKHYDEAHKAFEESAKQNYKTAASYYYLGEISYYTKKNEEAVHYYKKSANLYDKAGYMDVLLLHTAIALDRMGKKDQAKVFYENVITNYPQGKAAKIAREKMERE